MKKTTIKIIYILVGLKKEENNFSKIIHNYKKSDK